MSLSEFGQWYYLIYMVPGVAALLTISIAFMGGTDENQDADGDGEPDSVVDGDQMSDDGGDSDSDADDESGQKIGVIGGARQGRVRILRQSREASGSPLARLIGFGRVPAPFVWGSLLLGWSVVGFWATRTLEEGRHDPHLFATPAAIMAAVGALVTARLMSAGLARLAPKEESRAVSNVDLCGLKGSVVYPIDEARGRVNVYDQHHSLHSCRARTAPGHPPIAKGKSVLVVDYDAKDDVLIVEGIV